MITLTLKNKHLFNFNKSHEAFLSLVAKCLTETEFHDVKMDKRNSHRVRVTPFLNGKITNLKVIRILKEETF